MQDQFTVRFENVGTEWSERAIPRRPAKYIIKRARAEVVSGSGTQVALKVAKSSNGSTNDIELEYSLTDGFLDSEEEVRFKAKFLEPKNAGIGTTYLAVRSDAGPSTIVATIDYELES